MMTNTSSYHLLLLKLDQFIRKYYINKIIKGVLFTTALCVALFLLYSLLESQLYLSQVGRKVLLLSYLGAFLFSIGYWVILPVLNYFNLGHQISRDQAAQIIGLHFEDVKDKLLNILQLKRSEISAVQNELIEASINQKAESIKLIPFKQAIDLSKNRKHLRFALPPVAVALFILFAAPSLLTDSTYRILNNGIDFQKPAPYIFLLEDENPSVIQYEDYKLTIKVAGDKLPNEAFVRIDDYEYRLSKESPNEFSYLFSNVRKNTNFEVYSGKQSSGSKTLKILPKPKMVDFKVNIDYPAYTGRKDESIFNSGDLTIPEGSHLTWNFDTRSTDLIQLFDGDLVPKELEKNGNSSFKFSKKVSSDGSYKLVLTNDQVKSGDSLQFFLRSIKDQFPQIGVEFLQDSLDENIYYFVGSVSDDYGLTRLAFNFNKKSIQDKPIDSGSKRVEIPISVQSDFQYIMDIRDFKLDPGDQLDFYFEIFDNDQVNGTKSSKSQMHSHRKKSMEELIQEEEQNEEKIKDKLDESLKETVKIQEELSKLREKLLQKQEPDWQDKKQLQKLMERQKDLQKQLEEAKSAHEKNLKNQEELMNMTPEMQEKQKRIEELFNEMVNDEMKELMEQIQELMNELGKEQSLQLMDEFKMKEENLEKEMERLKELYKQLEVEKELNESIKDLNELAKKLDELSKKTEEKTEAQEKLKKEQKDINQKFDKLQEKMEDMKKKNDQLEFPKPMADDMPEQMDDAEEDLEKSEEQLEQQENKKASESQKSAAQKMKKMAAGMEQQMMSGESEQMKEDIKTLRQLLENLVNISFDQENLVNDVNRTVINTPKYVTLLQQQMKLKDDFKVVQDTLIALSKRQAQLETFILEKVGEIKSNMSSSLSFLEERQKPEANQGQRSSMKNLNDLALMLSETMEQMQKQMANMMSGTQMCQNPGQSSGKKQNQKGNSGNEPMDKISEGQEKMSDDLKEMIEKMKSGKGSTSKEFAQAAAKQAALRKALEQMSKEQQENGQGASDLLQQIMDQMDKQEIDLVNKRLDNEMLIRQQEIMTRLLEADKAQKEREWDEERKSESGKEVERILPPALEKYLNERKSILDQYRYVSPDLNPHYKRLVDEYYKKLKRA